MPNVTYVLIVWLYGYSGGGPATIGELPSRAACDSAGLAFMLETRDAGYYNRKYHCVVLDRRGG